MSPHRGRNKKREDSPLGRGLPALLCLWGCFWFPASNCGLGMAGNLIKHCQGLAEVAWVPAVQSCYPVMASSMSYIERNCVPVGREGRGGGSEPRNPEILFCFDKLLDSPEFLGIQPSAFGTPRRAWH